MTYEYLTPDQYQRVVYIAKSINFKTDRLIYIVIDWCDYYKSIDELLNDLEKVNA